MSNKKHITQELANAFLAVDWTIEDLTLSLTKSLGYSTDWAKPLLESIYQEFNHQFPDIKPKQLALFIFEHPLFDRAWTEHRIKNGHDLSIRNYTLQLPAIIPPILPCDVPEFKTVKDLANWLGLSVSKLEGYADCRGLERKSALFWQRHYHYIWKKKLGGSARLLEIPKSNLRAIQRQINIKILQNIPLHSACHGFRKGYSCRSYAQVHCAKPVVIKMDLKGFFSSISTRRIHAIFTSIGYRTEIAQLLTGLCTNQVPHDVLADNSHLSWQERKQYSTPHLPQGAPVSPALANLSAFKLDVRLDALMQKMTGSYTRYADDLALSGDFSKASTHRLHALVSHIAMDEEFQVNNQKTKIMRQGARQSLTGLVVNQHVNYPRYKYDKLKAILFNCHRFGARSQNQDKHDDFKAHLQGKIAYVKSVNPLRAKKLERLFITINWKK